MLSYKITPGESKTCEELINGINSVEKEMKILFPQLRWEFVEPDYED